MDSGEGQVQQSSMDLVQEVRHVAWSSVKTEIPKKNSIVPVKEWTCCKMRVSSKEQELLSSMSLSRLPAEGWPNFQCVYQVQDLD